MWAKITQALKSRPETDHSNAPNDVMSRVYEQHPNLSVFHEVDDVSPLNAGPPGSPSKHGRRGMFRRISKMPKNGDDESLRASSPMLPIGLPKKLKSNFNHSQVSLARTSTDAIRSPEEPRPSQDASSNILRRASHDILRQSSRDNLQFPEIAGANAHNASSDVPQETASLAIRDTSRPSLDISRSFLTPLDKYSSVRSILRDPKTPGTGQNVRFFSRDAYKVISPDASLATDAGSGLEKPAERGLPFIEKLQQASSTPLTKSISRPSIAEVFAPIDASKDSTSMDSMPLASAAPPPDISAFFNNISRDHDLPPIPIGFNIPLFDNAIEMIEPDVENKPKNSVTSSPATNMTSTPNHAKMNESPPASNHGPSFSFGQTLFYSMANTSPTGSEHSKASSLPTDLGKYKDVRPATAPASQSSGKFRNRALSDTVFQNMIRGAGKNPPEADINDELSSQLVVYSTPAPEPDPFSAHATTYYTPQTMIPPTPPRETGRHAKKTSREEDLIVTLRTQLALQSELGTQYEVDLRARDELVEVLEKRLAAAEREGEKRRNVLKVWKKKVGELERTCRHLEEEVDLSRQESMERSIMDEASGEALRMLHTQIAALEHEKKEVEKREEALRDEVGTLEGLVKEKTDDVQRLNETLWTQEESKQELKADIRGAKEHVEQAGHLYMVGEDVKMLILKAEQANEEEKERHRLVEDAWDQERVNLVMQSSQLQTEKDELEYKLNDFSTALKAREDELGVLKNELEAQWKHTESATEKTERLEKDKGLLQQEQNALQEEVKLLRVRVGGLELEWTQCENKRADLEIQVQELWSMRDAIEKERDEADEQLRSEKEHADALTHTLQEREDRLIASEQERQFALENISRLEEKVRQRDVELAESADRIVRRESDAEQLREEMSDMKRQHARVVDEHVRALQETTGQEGEAKRHLEALIKDRAEADVAIEAVKEQANALKEEIERLRRQVQNLQQESADKEVKIVQITKQRAQDQEDLHGLNIALDSKQQELELMKRRLGVKGTAGSTPAQPSKVAHRRETSTPILTRPLSIVSDSGISDKKSTDTPAKTPALGKSVRANGAGPQPAGSMGPPASVKPRVSGMNTPTPLPRALSRSSSTRPTPQSTPLHHRSVSSAMDQQTRIKPPRVLRNASPAPTRPESEEKENVEESGKEIKKRIMIPVTA